jgi:predicted small integral membrane protein
VSVNDVRQILTDPRFDRNRRLLRLQGQRDSRLDQAVAAGWAMRLGPAQCALFGTIALLLSDPSVYLVLAAVSSVGVFTSHHPVEWAYVWWTRRQGRTPPPANRAPRRFACLLGAASFGLAAVGLVAGAAPLFWSAALLLVVLPAFVAVTNICVPSLVFTLMVGAERATCESLPASLARDGRTQERQIL